jgi:hypothetical protein
MVASRGGVALQKIKISQKFSGFEKLLLVGVTCNFSIKKYFVLPDDIRNYSRLFKYNLNPHSNQRVSFA